MDGTTFATVVSQGGLDSRRNHLLMDQQSPGAAARLVNYEVGIYGGYRRINGYDEFDSTYPTVDNTSAEGRILGIHIYRDLDGTETIIAARKQKSGNTYKFYYYDSTSGWTAYAPGFTLNTTGTGTEIIKIRSASIVFGDKSYIIFVDGVNYPSVFDGTSWYQLVDGVQAGTSADPGGDQALPDPQYIWIFKNHVFMAGDSTYGTIVWHSAPEDVFNWNAAAGAGQIPVGFQVVQIRPFREELFVWGNPGLKKISVESTTFVLADVASNVGCIASDSVLEIGGDIIFLSEDGIRTVSGTDKIGDVNLLTLSKQIQNVTKGFSESWDLRYLNSVLIPNKSQFRYYISDQLITSSGYGIMGGLRGTDQQVGWEFGEISGIRTSVTCSGYYNQQELVLHGDFDGTIYKQEYGSTFNGTAITSIYATPYLTFGDPLTRKSSRKLHTFLRPEGDILLNVGLTFDWENPYVHNPDSFSSESSSGVAEYDSGVVYDGSGVIYSTVNTNPVVSLDIEGSFRSVQITYTTTSQTDPFSIHGFIYEIIPQGKR